MQKRKKKAQNTAIVPYGTQARNPSRDRYQVQKQLFLSGKPLGDGATAYGNEVTPDGGRKLMARLVAEEVENNKNSHPSRESRGEDVTILKCKGGLTICFAVVKVTVPW